MVDVEKSALLKEFGFKEEEAELLKGEFLPTGFPESIKRYNLVYSEADMNVESPYYWIIDFMKAFYPIFDKIEDSFSASENSAFFGVTQQRLGIQQDKVGQYLANIGRMVKELFQMVRELRILDERLTYYNGAKKEMSKELKNRERKDEITLKGIFIDLVQGGGKSPASVYGMARDLEFVTLPDLFFDAPPLSTDELEKYVDNLEGFNDAVLRVLKRHLRHFQVWKEQTHKEHANRKEFMLRYLRQHYDIVQMYIVWIKPYLKNAKRLTTKTQHQDSAELISSFEGSMMDIEVLAHHPKKDSCVLVTFNYRTRPHMKFQNEGYQRGPVHVGKMNVQFRVYDWDKETIAKYKKLKERESLYLIGDVSQSVLESMHGLGEELERYLEEADKKLKKKEPESENKKEKPKVSLTRKMFGDFMPPPKKESDKLKKPKKVKLKDGKFDASLAAWITFNTFKKAHRMISW